MIRMVHISPVILEAQPSSAAPWFVYQILKFLLVCNGNAEAEQAIWNFELGYGRRRGKNYGIRYIALLRIGI